MKEYKLKNGIVKQYIGSEESINHIKDNSGNELWKKFINYHSNSLFIFDKIEYVLEIISGNGSKRKFYIFKNKNDTEFSTTFNSIPNENNFNGIFGNIFFEWLKTYGGGEKITKTYYDICDESTIHLIEQNKCCNDVFDIESLKIKNVEISGDRTYFTIDIFCENNVHLWLTSNKYIENGVSKASINRGCSNVYFSTDYNEIVNKQQELVKNEINCVDNCIEELRNKKKKLRNKLIKLTDILKSID